MSTSSATLPATDGLSELVAAACAHIAPAWPLDRLIAVNPYHGLTQRHIADASAELGALAASPMLMPRSWFRERLAVGALEERDIEHALRVTRSTETAESVRRALATDAAPLPRHPLVTDIRDAMRASAQLPGVHTAALEQIGRAGESFVSTPEVPWQENLALDFYAHWRELARSESAPRLLLGVRGWGEAIDELPGDPMDLIRDALETLALPTQAREAYLAALLFDVGGWAAAFAHRRWEARLRGGDDRSIESLLAVRLAWELVLYRTAVGTDLPAQWTRARRAWQERAATVRAEQAPDWVLQRAVELRYHDRLGVALSSVPSSEPPRSGPAALATTRAQAVFCIDVRSEVMRRALETEDRDVRTLGFAGFFGLPIAYQTVDGHTQFQLPGLLAPSMVVEDRGEGREAETRRRLAERESKAALRPLAGPGAGMFPYVEATGLGALWKLLRATFAAPSQSASSEPELLNESAPLVPKMTATIAGDALTVAQRADVAAGVLRGMSLTEGFARLVAFIGHGARVTNNPQSAGLACGACGGNAGDVNARALAALLNDGEVRGALAERSIVIPTTTHFIAGLHDTVTDDVTLFTDGALPASHVEDVIALKASLARAARRTRRERAPRLGITLTDDRALADAFRERGVDWSEVRPEWGLARNAAFIVAPRARTRTLDLDGRAFLHEYLPSRDAEAKVLEQILTAPAIVAHWINFQYWASTVDPERFGSGDKTLHNVVGGNVGVVEGAGGDLRIGLALQSVHDGRNWVHEPLRLGVYVEAAEAPIERIVAGHALLRSLVQGEWIFLYRIDPETGRVTRRGPAGWEAVP